MTKATIALGKGSSTGKAKLAKEPQETPLPLTELLRLPAGEVDMSSFDPRAATGFPGAKAEAPGLTEALAPELGDLQERLFATGRSDPAAARNVLVVLQGMDTSGKGGIVRHAIGMVDPQGVKITSFKAPTKTELAHPFLWRIERALPDPGMIAIFDRSHYEDLLVARVNRLVGESVLDARYGEINAWEENLARDGTVLIKCFLHISAAGQKERLIARLDDPTKHWKYKPSDVDARSRWPAYASAYQAVLERCSTQHAPWFVIPSDRKWYRNWAVAQLLLEHLRAMNLQWPLADFDVEHEKARLAGT